MISALFALLVLFALLFTGNCQLDNCRPLSTVNTDEDLPVSTLPFPGGYPSAGVITAVCDPRSDIQINSCIELIKVNALKKFGNDRIASLNNFHGSADGYCQAEVYLKTDIPEPPLYTVATEIPVSVADFDRTLYKSVGIVTALCDPDDRIITRSQTFPYTTMSKETTMDCCIRRLQQTAIGKTPKVMGITSTVVSKADKYGSMGVCSGDAIVSK